MHKLLMISKMADARYIVYSIYPFKRIIVEITFFSFFWSLGFAGTFLVDVTRAV